MSRENKSTVTRRGFLREAGLLAGAAAVVSSNRAARGAAAPQAEPQDLPRRVLGRTQQELTLLTLGSAPCGIAPEVPVAEIARIVNAALDEGVNSIDTAPKYVKAEEGIGLALGRRRKDVFLATKVWADTIADAEQSLTNSLKTLKTDYVDLLYFHHLGDRDMQRARQADGVFTWLRQQKQAGKCRFLGISGHNLPGRMPAFLESGDVDVLLTVVNYVDRHTYRFEEDILPIAQKHDVGIVAMKVFGGPDPKTGSWDNPRAKPLVGEENVELAVRYALSTPGVATANLGVHTLEQLRQNIQIVRRFQPLSADERQALVQRGQDLASVWGPHFGPVTEAERVGATDRAKFWQGLDRMHG